MIRFYLAAPLLVLVLSLCEARAVQAAEGNDAQMWTEVGARYKLIKKLSLSFDHHTRFDGNISRLQGLMPEVALRYRPFRGMRLAAGYRLVYERNKDDKLAVAHRFHANVQLRYSVGPVRLGYRARFQQRIETEKRTVTLRNRGRLQLKTRLFTPFVEAELFTRATRVDGNLGSETHKFRFGLGSSVALTNEHELDVWYRFVRPVADDNDPDLHIIGIAYHFDISARAAL